MFCIGSCCRTTEHVVFVYGFVLLREGTGMTEGFLKSESSEVEGGELF